MSERGRDADERDAKQLLDSGSRMIGATAGGALGSIAGPPGVLLGAAGGVAVTDVMKRVGSAIFRRHLEERQEGRAGAAFGFAAALIDAELAEGAKPRRDGFLDKPDGSRRTGAEELLEGTLKAAADEHEERKI